LASYLYLIQSTEIGYF